VLLNRGVDEWYLTIAGSGTPSYVQELQTLATELGLAEHVRFLGHVTGVAKADLFRVSDLLVLPSHKENFGMTVLEALEHGMPVIVSKGTPWRDVERIDCGLWVDNHPESLAHAIARCRTVPLKELGERGRIWVYERFSSARIGQQMFSLYQQLLTGR